eukprot:jgi/Chlat1/1324/Chrsp118S01723
MTVGACWAVANLWSDPLAMAAVRRRTSRRQAQDPRSKSGHQPAVVVWDTTMGGIVAELKTHQYGSACFAASASGKHLVSVEGHHDGLIVLWDWKNAMQLIRHKATLSRGAAAEGRALTTGMLKDSTFVSLVVGSDGGSVYAVTNEGVLCLFAKARSVDKVRKAFANAVCDLRVACSDSTVRLFTAGTTQYEAMLPRPSSSPMLYGANANSPVLANKGADAKLPDAVACAFLGESKDCLGAVLLLGTIIVSTVAYSSHSHHIWDLRNIAKKAHDAEVLNVHNSTGASNALLASGGRDRLTHTKEEVSPFGKVPAITDEDGVKLFER